MRVTTEEFGDLVKRLAGNLKTQRTSPDVAEHLETVVRPKHKARPKQRDESAEAKLNKLETAWLAELRRRHPGEWIGIQCFSLRLTDTRIAGGRNCNYRPDLWTCTEMEGLVAYEVKGFMREAARIRILVAAEKYPMITFILVTRQPKRLGGHWVETEIQP